jgi:hypothetical protein
MAALEQLDGAVGGWAGTNLLRLMPTDPYRESETHATVARAAGGDVVVINYTWAEAGEPQDGMLIISGGDEAGQARAVWVDSWHQRPQWLELSGVAEAGVVRLAAPYAEGFEWRIKVDASTADALVITMDNVAPGVSPYQVVEARYTRTP